MTFCTWFGALDGATLWLEWILSIDFKPLKSMDSRLERIENLNAIYFSICTLYLRIPSIAIFLPGHANAHFDRHLSLCVW